MKSETDLPFSVEPIKYNPPTNRSNSNKTYVLMISDLQIGHKTKTFNKRTINLRAKKLLHRAGSVMEAGSIVHIALLGDIVHNELVGRNVNLEELEMPLKQQLFDVAVPVLASIIQSLSETHKSVIVHCVAGNHGVNGKFASLSNNADLFSYLVLKQLFRNHKNVKFDIADTFYLTTTIRNKRFLMVHGDQIPMYMNLPYYGISRRALNWFTSIGPFDFLLMGHFHTATQFTINTIRVLINGAWVTDDQWTLKKLGATGSCSQLVLDITDSHRVTTTEVDLL